MTTAAPSYGFADSAVLTLSGPVSLERLRDASVRRSFRRIAVVGEWMPRSESVRLERDLNRWYFACGCEQGSVAVLVTLLTSIVLGSMRGFDGSFVWWRVGCYALAAALAGKVIGLAYSKVRLSLLYRRLGVLTKFAPVGPDTLP